MAGQMHIGGELVEYPIETEVGSIPETPIGPEIGPKKSNFGTKRTGNETEIGPKKATTKLKISSTKAVNKPKFGLKRGKLIQCFVISYFFI